MSNKLITNLQFQIDEINKYYPEIVGKVEHCVLTTKVTLGTIIRIKNNKGIWYDIPITEYYTIPLDSFNNDAELFKVHINFNKKVYIHKHFFIPNDKIAVISKWQITEEERLLETYKPDK